MKQQQLVILVAVLVGGLLITLVAKSIRQGNVDEVDPTIDSKRLLSDLPVNELNALSIQEGEAALHVEKKDGTWAVRERADYPADFDKVRSFLQTAYQMEPVDTVLVGSKYDRVGVADPAAEDTENPPMVITFQKGEGEDAATLWVGKEYQIQEASQFGSFDSTVGRYLRLPGSDTVYKVSEPFDDASTAPADWLNKDFFRVRKIKTIERIPSGDAAGEGWKLTREEDKADYTLVDAKEGEDLDLNATGSMKSAFSSPSFDDVVVGEEVKKPSALVFKIETFDGFHYELTFGEPNELKEYNMTVKVEGKFAKKRKPAEEETEEEKAATDETFAAELKELEDKLAQEKKLEGHIYKVRSFVLDSVNKPRADLLVKDDTATAGAVDPSVNMLPEGSFGPQDLLMPQPSGEGEAKAEEGEAKAQEGEAKAQEGEAKAQEGEASAEEGEAKAEEGEAKAEEGEAKAEEGEAKAEEGEAKAEEGEAKAKEGEDKPE